MWVKVYRKSATTIGARCRFEVIIDVASFWIGGILYTYPKRSADWPADTWQSRTPTISFSRGQRTALFAWQILTLGSWNVPADEQTNHKYSECWTMGNGWWVICDVGWVTWDVGCGMGPGLGPGPPTLPCLAK